MFNVMEPNGLFIYIAARLIAARTIGIITDVHVPGGLVPRSALRTANYYFEKFWIRRFDALVTATDKIRDDLAPSKPYVRIEGILGQEQLCRPPACHDNAKAPFELVAVGRLDSVNGFPEIIDAFMLLPKDRFVLNIAGSGPLEEAIADLATRNPGIRFHGSLNHNAVLDLYRSADLHINMRITKGLHTHYAFPSKLIEYMASGVPVISTCTGHAFDAFGEVIFFLEDETGAGLAKMIEHVASLHPDARAARGRAAQTFVRETMSWQNQGHRLVQFIQRVAQKAT